MRKNDGGPGVDVKSFSMKAACLTISNALKVIGNTVGYKFRKLCSLT